MKKLTIGLLAIMSLNLYAVSYLGVISLDEPTGIEKALCDSSLDVVKKLGISSKLRDCRTLESMTTMHFQILDLQRELKILKEAMNLER